MSSFSRFQSIALVTLRLSLNFFSADAAAIATKQPHECDLSFYDVNNDTCYFDIQNAPIGTFVQCALHNENTLLQRVPASPADESNNIVPIIFVHSKQPTNGTRVEFRPDANFTINLYDGAGEKVLQNIMTSTDYQKFRSLGQAQRVTQAFQSGLYLYGSTPLPESCRTRQGVLFMYMWTPPADLDAHTPYKVLLSTDGYRYFSWSGAFTLADGPISPQASAFG